ncbi:MAG TPA: M28 family peptidase, partial [Armatimonadota bacterium]|nr:M28 family peptidase [Armatimonadota bacterium]
MRPRFRSYGVLAAAICLSFAVTALAAATARFDAARSYRDLVTQCEFGPRVPGTQAHAECARWLTQTLYACADVVSVQTFSRTVGGKALPLSNIVATFNPAGTGHVLLAAHWDTRPTADRDPDPANRSRPILGANDGASGVAVLLEIARVLKAHPPRPRVTIVLFDGEDYGPTAEDMFLGSKHFTRTFAGPEVEWAVLLDMVGDRDLKIRPERFSVQGAPAVVDRIWAAAEKAGATAFVRDPGPAVLDDHVFLLDRG